MISGHLHEKNGRFYMVLNLRDKQDNWKPKWIATGLPVKGNKKRAESMLRDAIRKYEARATRPVGSADEILFSDYMLRWLEQMRGSVEETTFTSIQNRSFALNILVPLTGLEPVRSLIGRF